MRKLSAVSLALIVAGGAASGAAAQDGYLLAAGGASRLTDSGGSSFSGGTWQGRGSFQTTLDGMWKFQGDAVLTFQDLNELDSNERLDTVDLAAHVYYHFPSNALFGVIGQHSGDLLGRAPYWSDLTVQWYGGVEGLAYWNNFSLYGQLAVTTATDGGDTSNGGAATLRARYFVNPNLFVEAKAGVERLTFESESVDSTLLGAAIEYQCATLPMSVFARYTHVTQTYSYYSRRDNADRILVGAKWNFGGKSLWERETMGAALDPFELTHVVVRDPN